MPDMVLRVGDATPSNVILRTFVGDVVAATLKQIGDFILYADVALATTTTAASAPLTLYTGDASPTTVVFRLGTNPTLASTQKSYTVVLRAFGTLAAPAPPPPPPPPPPPTTVARFLTLLGVGT